MSHRPRDSRRVPTALGLALALSAAPPLAPAQQTSPSGTNISTGSGAGTGTMPQNPSPNRTLPDDLTRPGVPRPDYRGGPGRPGPRQGPEIGPERPLAPLNAPSGPGDLSVPTFPGDTTLGMPPALNDFSRAADPSKIKAVEERLLSDARDIADPADRALAFERAAEAYVLADRWDDAIQALREGGQAALNVQDPILRDVRLQGLVGAAIAVADDLVRESTPSALYLDLTSPTRVRPAAEREHDLEDAQAVVDLGSELARQIGNDNYAAYALSQIAQAQAANSATVATKVDEPLGSTYISPGLELGTQPQPPETPPAAPQPQPQPAEDRAASNVGLAKLAHEMLQQADRIAWQIPLPVWRDQTLVVVVGSAAASAQFGEGSRMARRIPNAEARSDAQIRLAEAMARRGRQEQATAAYQEAVTSVVSIPLDDPRQTLGAVLLDSLLAVGRFEDARATAALILKPEIRLRALGAIARSMGERGLADEAIAWIRAEVEPAFHDRMLREVNQGLVLWLREQRTTVGGARGFPEIFPPTELEDLMPMNNPGR